jgi:hypothetical protein
MALKLKALNMVLTIMFIAYRVVGTAGKRRSVFTVVKFTTPQTGKIAHFSGCMGIKFRLMNALEWGFNYELHFQNNGNNERIQQ